LKIKDLIAKLKDKSLSQSEEKLQVLFKKLYADENNSKDAAEVVKLKVDLYYQYFHQRILAVKEWPFDWKIIVQILSSFVIPIVVWLLETFLK
jgi:hypothetical protein